MYARRQFQTIASPTQSNDYVLALDTVCDWLQQINLMNFHEKVIMQISLKQFCKKLKNFYFSFIAIVTTTKIKELCKFFILVLLQL